MDNFLMAYITERMAEMGFKTFHFEPIRIFANTNKIIVAAHNEYYYLISKAVPAGLVIESDTNIFNEASGFPNFTYYRIQEFSGQIEISQPAAPIDLQFMQVVPQCPCFPCLPSVTN